MGFNVFDPSSYGQAISDLGSALSGLGSAAVSMIELVLPGGNVTVTFWAETFAGGKYNPGDLWNALGKDYAQFQKDGDAAQKLEDGDYIAAWNISTDNGAQVTNLIKQLGAKAPQPQPVRGYDATSLYNSAIAGKVDLRDAAQQLFDHAYYTQGNALLSRWRSTLFATPTGAVFAAIAAKNTGKPAIMYHLANTLDTLSTDQSTENSWKTHGWGLPANVFGPVSKQLRIDAQAAVPKKAKPMPFVINLKPVSTAIGLRPPVNTESAITSLAPGAPAPKPAPPQAWYQKTLFTLPTAAKTPVTVGEAGVLAALAAGAAKFFL